MKTAQRGNLVKIHYNIKLDNGETAGTTRGGQPLSFTIGKGKVMKKLEQGIIGMQLNESRTIKIEPEHGFGQRNESLVLKVKKEEIQTQMEIAPGRTIQYKSETGESVNFIIRDFDEHTVTIDGNHPFAGENLTFEVVLVAIL
ncbi:Peptidyl-prolyl cis-trans isomerase, FKBP-type [Desulfonema limicola]|uniref:Peptidyl-prolyl cis-trans isomerase n=1 Tax=Desulfonema limicola TaxID=45656 RepID=A0A975B9B6_9BACT|nr:FKBP-type peptidyl-prolyl cis-trans isomerase [Desulfonema limicola]QTA81047.1 Peptidyl-prolyl cis-trans isomerase, FKBP-type [Desulfonema limicola]